MWTASSHTNTLDSKNFMLQYVHTYIMREIITIIDIITISVLAYNHNITSIKIVNVRRMKYFTDAIKFECS